MELGIGLFIVIVVILLLGKLADVAMDRGSFALFLVLSLIGSALFVMAMKAATGIAARQP